MFTIYFIVHYRNPDEKMKFYLPFQVIHHLICNPFYYIKVHQSPSMKLLQRYHSSKIQKSHSSEYISLYLLWPKVQNSKLLLKGFSCHGEIKTENICGFLLLKNSIIQINFHKSKAISII